MNTRAAGGGEEGRQGWEQPRTHKSPVSLHDNPEGCLALLLDPSYNRRNMKT